MYYTIYLAQRSFDYSAHTEYMYPKKSMHFMGVP
jgi:hypothetical protein